MLDLLSSKIFINKRHLSQLKENYFSRTMGICFILQLSPDNFIPQSQCDIIEWAVDYKSGSINYLTNTVKLSWNSRPHVRFWSAQFFVWILTSTMFCFWPCHKVELWTRSRVTLNTLVNDSDFGLSSMKWGWGGDYQYVIIPVSWG